MPDRPGAVFDIRTEGEQLSGYLAHPAGGTGRGVLVLHEAWGLVDPIRDVCDRLARSGFVALAPDLFRGGVAETLEAAGRRVASLDADRVGLDLDACVAALLDHHAVEGGRVGVVGFCMGGHLALVCASRTGRVAAAVDFYGVDTGVPLELSGLEAAVLAIFGGNDEYVPADAIACLREQLDTAGCRAGVLVEPDAGHAFMNEARPDRYDAAAAARGWNRMLAFLRAELVA